MEKKWHVNYANIQDTADMQWTIKNKAWNKKETKWLLYLLLSVWYEQPHKRGTTITD